MAWQWLENTGNWIGNRWNDGVEIMAVAVAPIVNPIADGRVPYFQGRPSDEYLPEVYQRADQVMRRGLSTPVANPTSAQQEARRREIEQAHIAGLRANAEVQEATANYQRAGVTIMTLPTAVLTAGLSFPVMLGTDLAILEGGEHLVNAVSPGPRPDNTLGMTLVNLGAATTGNQLPFAPGTATVARQQLDSAVAIQQIDESVARTMRRLIRNGGNELTLTDLDRNGDGILTASDATEVRRVLDNDALADRLFATLRDRGITFNNQRISDIQVTSQVSFDSVAGGQVGAGERAGNQPTVAGGQTNNEPGFFGKIWSGIVSIFNSIVNLFKGSASSNPSSQTVASTGASPVQSAGNAEGQVSVAPPNTISIPSENQLRR